MSNDNLVQDERDLNLDTCHFGLLKKLAKDYGISAQRDWKREDYVKQIKIAQGESIPNAVPTPVQEDAPVVQATRDERAEEATLLANYSLPSQSHKNDANGVLKPGYARIVLHKDPTPGHANSPVQVGLNGKFFHIPRGIEVDLPLEYVDVLIAAKQSVMRQKTEPSPSNPAGEVVWEDIYSYPFQVIAVKPGKAFNSAIDQRGSIARRKEAFVAKIGKWPTTGELIEFEKEERLVLRSLEHRGS